MANTIETDICVIGAGSAGLSAAAGAVQMGADTVLIEAGRMGGDCLNTGCVPSKALLAAAHAAYRIRTAGALGIDAHPIEVDFAQVYAHVHKTIAHIAPHDSQQRFEALGCKVIRAHARFKGPDRLEAGEYCVRARRFLIATGSRPSIPEIPGLVTVPYLTNETVFELSERPRHLIIVGGGPIGCELGQAFARLGSSTTIIDRSCLLSRDDPECVAVLRQSLQQDGIELYEGVGVSSVVRNAGDVVVTLSDGRQLEASHLLIAAGRKPNIEDLGLDLAGVACSARGIAVDARLRSSNRRIFAIGDVTGGPLFTHVAGYHAGIALRNALFRIPARTRLTALPWATYTDPELAQVGLRETEARAQHGDRIRVLRADFAANDRAVAECRGTGFLKVMTTRRGRIVGASIVGHGAGELLAPWTLALSAGLKIGAMAQVIAPYPTLSEISKRVAGTYYAPTLFGPRVRRLVRLLSAFG